MFDEGCLAFLWLFFEQCPLFIYNKEDLDNVLQEAVVGCQRVDGSVTLTLAADESADGNSDVLGLVLDHAALSINTADIELDASVVVGDEETVGERAEPTD